MIRGVGIDMASIEDIRRYMAASDSGAFLRRTFTQAERAEGRSRPDLAEYYAARFAAKEAVFKAVAHLTAEKTFDLRIVETLNAEDGSPYVNTRGELGEILREAGVDALHISITTEGSFAAAFVVAWGGCNSETDGRELG